jgi:hypothetical protein
MIKAKVKLFDKEHVSTLESAINEFLQTIDELFLPRILFLC